MFSDVSKTAVDTHFHVFRAGIAQAGARYAPAYDAPFSSWQANAQPLGVGRGVLVQTSFMGSDNTQLVAELERWPGVLRGVAVVGPEATLQTLQPLHRAGVRAIRLNLAGVSHALREWSKAAPLWDALALLGWHLELHTDIGRLPEVLAQLPGELPLVIDHMGKPEAISADDATVRALAERARRSNVHLKLSGAYRLGGLNPGELSRLWLGELGAGRLLWGSDWPCTNHESLADYPGLLNSLHEWLGDEAVIETVLSTNPRRLYWGD
ncbi:amidohydrolase family protein [Polaromonas naphthalenivorans]|uniref:Amidohydrolase 2 n=1 Tax=Polaromonas naphthalenivorans (strain CJ2) TaxID=365044 RepID=A1VUP2_POLNA|nr:amidohydrolase family protein [Polaromonas naphthalenivorans]ABM39370.1 amidohydrolase 2 [Polaromonas naphthalenivorans CJ2]